MEELENKIREALPRLKELTKGCIIYGVDGDFHQFGSYAEVINVKIETDYTKTYILDCFTIDSGRYNHFFTTKKCWDTYNVKVIGHPIKLNDVLEYIKIKDTPVYNTTEVNTIAFGTFPKIQYWDLSSVFLSDQSEELKEFLNGL